MLNFFQWKLGNWLSDTDRSIKLAHTSHNCKCQPLTFSAEITSKNSLDQGITWKLMGWDHPGSDDLKGTRGSRFSTQLLVKLLSTHETVGIEIFISKRIFKIPQTGWVSLAHLLCSLSLCRGRKISRIHAELCYAIKEKVTPWDWLYTFLYGLKSQLHFLHSVKIPSTA